MTITVLSFRGNSERLGSNLLTNVTKQLPRERFQVIDVPHPATMGPAGGQSPLTDPSEMESVRIGVEKAWSLICATTNPIVLLGYSLGGVIATEVLRRVKGTDRDNQVKLLGTVANPRRPEGISYGRPGVGEGIFGDFIEDKRQWAAIASPGDIMTSMPLGSPIRQGSNLIQWMSFSDPIRWAADVQAKLPGVADALILKKIQQDPFIAFKPEFWQPFVTAGLMLDAYARGGAHTDVYYRKEWRDWRGQPISGVDLLANVVRGAKYL